MCATLKGGLLPLAMQSLYAAALVTLLLCFSSHLCSHGEFVLMLIAS